MKKLNNTYHKNYLNIGRSLSFSVFGRGIQSLLNEIDEKIKSDSRLWIATVNPEFVIESVNSTEFNKILNSTWLNVPDGVGLVWADEVNNRSTGGNFGVVKRLFWGLIVGLEILSGRHRERLVTGVDLMNFLVLRSVDKKQKLFFLGGFENRAKETMEYFLEKYNLEKRRVGFTKGIPKESNSDSVKKINDFGPDILFVAYGMKKQEEWIRDNLDKLKVGLVIGVGRSFDYYSGALKRAPEWIRKMGLEWLYSLYKEPKRWRRQLKLPRFIWWVLKNKLS